MKMEFLSLYTPLYDAVLVVQAEYSNALLIKIPANTI